MYKRQVEGAVHVNEASLEKVRKRMRELVEMDMPIHKRTIHTDDAVALFRQHGMHDKERLFEDVYKRQMIWREI